MPSGRRLPASAPHPFLSGKKTPEQDFVRGHRPAIRHGL